MDMKENIRPPPTPSSEGELVVVVDESVSVLVSDVEGLEELVEV